MKTISIEKVAEVVDKNGLRFAIEKGIPFDEIENLELKVLMKNAQLAVSAVQEFLQKELGDEYFTN